MATAAILRRQIEAALEQRIPSALTPPAKVRSALHATGIRALDELLGGGLPEAAVSELVGPECSGRTAVALAFVARMTRAGKVCAWVDVTDSLDPVSAAAAGVSLRRMLWVRCGVTARVGRRGRFEFKVPELYFVPPVVKKGLHGGGFGGHPRNEVKGMAGAVGRLEAGVEQSRSQKRDLGHPPTTTATVGASATATANAGVSAPHRAELVGDPVSPLRPVASGREDGVLRKEISRRPWGRMEQGMRAADLLLQAGGFGAVVLDMGGLSPEFCSRVPLATWFRYRAAAERTRTSVVLLTQVACAKSSAELVLRMNPAEEILAEPTVFAGLRPRVERMRQRFAADVAKPANNVVSIRKPPQREAWASWQSRTAGAGQRWVGL